MRKQTKLVAVLSAAALLAIGASMTSFAAGWQKNDDGSWNYYDNDDEMVAGEWQKDANKWFYLDDDGVMLTDSWVDDLYYVGEDGAMTVNAWRKLTPEDNSDDPEGYGEYWYYFGSKGKKTGEDGATHKKIGGKTYYFDDAGKMETGWFEDGTETYYLGAEDDGARAAGWLWLESWELDDDLDGDSECEKCEDEGWYYFNTSSGKMTKSENRKKINGKYYYFNEHGQMLYEWIDNSSASAPTADHEATSPVGISGLRYANDVEEGWEGGGWYQIDGALANDAADDTDWYYFKDGKAKTAEAKDKVKDDNAAEVSATRARIKIAGKYFCFNEKGQMETGLQRIGSAFYYFDENGYMKTGKVSNVEEDDDDTYTYYFETKSGGNGKGIDGPKSGYLYWNGKRLEAADDYAIYNVKGLNYIVNNSGKIQKTVTKTYTIENVNGFNDEIKGVKENPKADSNEVVLAFTKDGALKTPNFIDAAGSTGKVAAMLPEITLYEKADKTDAVWTQAADNKTVIK